MEWKTRHSEEVFSSPYVIVHKDEVSLPNGEKVDDFYTVTVPDAAVIVALTIDGQLILERDYRYSCKEELIELPAGTFNIGENDPLVVAKRELLEETGYESNDWQMIGTIRESSSKLTNVMYVFLAQNCFVTSKQRLDPTEDIKVFLKPMKDAVKMVMDNEIYSSSSAYGILKASMILSG